jgi:hypothetical protein
LLILLFNMYYLLSCSLNLLAEAVWCPVLVLTKSIKVNNLAHIVNFSFFQLILSASTSNLWKFDTWHLSIFLISFSYHHEYSIWMLFVFALPCIEWETTWDTIWFFFVFPHACLNLIWTWLRRAEQSGARVNYGSTC